MKRFFLLNVFFISQLICFAQKSDASKYASLITGEGLKKHLTIIASDEMQGRETGTEGQRKAAKYIEDYFKSIGLEYPKSLNGYRQFYPLKQDSVMEATLTLGDYKATFGTDFMVQLNMIENSGFIGDAVVFAGYGIDDALYSDYEKIDVKGKIVLFITGEPKKNGKYFISANEKSSEWTYPGYEKKLQTAYEKGAIGALVLNPLMKTFSESLVKNNKKTNVFFPGNNEPAKPLSFTNLSHEAARKILGDDFENIMNAARNNQMLNSVVREIPLHVDFNFKKNTNTIDACNILGVIEGSEKKDEYVFLTAHYDHLGMHDGKIYNGADDDGSGTVAVLQMANAFAQAKKDGKGPKRTIVFMTVSGEEKGLWGSEFYTDNPVFPLDKTSVDLNTDMIGRIDTERKTADTMNYVYVVGHDKISSELPIINEGVNNTNTKLVLDYRFDDPKDPNMIYYRSDHYNFARKGVPVLFFYDGMLKSDYHKPTDDVEKITWPLYEKRARMIFLTAWEMANRKEMLIRDKPLSQ